ncbi:MAG TPA: hypothetical protein DCP71_00270 [Verrucomicrobiales bacterium]|jgi:hypothetical protein|nr:hypothetical protein [Verrucomicrobiales bacterium]
MRSQKQTNKPPRPFKSGNSNFGWGGNSNGGFIPGQKPAVKVKKKTADDQAKPASESSPPAQE